MITRRWMTLIAGVACLLGVSIALLSAYSPRPFTANAAPVATVTTLRPLTVNALTATAGQRNALWQPTYEAEMTCNHSQPPILAQVILPDVSGMAPAEARCALIQAGMRLSIDEMAYAYLPTDAPRVAEYRIFGVQGVQSDADAGSRYQHLIPGMAVAPDASLAIIVYAPHG